MNIFALDLEVRYSSFKYFFSGLAVEKLVAVLCSYQDPQLAALSLRSAPWRFKSRGDEPLAGATSHRKGAIMAEDNTPKAHRGGTRTEARRHRLGLISSGLN